MLILVNEQEKKGLYMKLVVPVNVNLLQEGKAESAQDTVHDEHEGVPLPSQDANLGEREGERSIAGDAAWSAVLERATPVKWVCFLNVRSDKMGLVWREKKDKTDSSRTREPTNSPNVKTMSK